MSVLTLEGWVEGGQVRLREEAALPDKTKVYVVVPGAEEQVPRIRSPRLADPAEASQFEMEVTELPEGRLDAELGRRAVRTASPGSPRSTSQRGAYG